MIGLMRRTKVLYSIYNFFHRKELYRNELLLKKLGINKKYYSSLSSKDFSGLPGSKPQDIAINKIKLASCEMFKSLNEVSKESLLSFEDNGYAVIKNYLSEEQSDIVNNEIQTLLEEKKLDFKYGNRIMFAIHASKHIWNIGNDERLKEILSVLLGGKALLFQSINFLMGSQQATHSDSIHMTTYPLGGLLGVWIALEDISEDNGPLHYYIGSHKWPYYLNSDYDNEGNSFFIGDKLYKDYEKMIAKKIAERKHDKQKFLAKKGDLLIWHANLFHGGDPHINKDKTRKSMVFHYFNEESICYHEITQRPALIKKFN